MRLKVIVKSCVIGLALVSLLPASTYAAKRFANGVFIEEPVKEEKKEQIRIAECGFSRPIRIATLFNNRPFGWAEYETSGGFTTIVSKGFGINMFEEIAKKLKLKYQVVGYTKDQQAINDIKRGRLDILIGVYNPSITVGQGARSIEPAIFTNVFAVYFLKDKAFEVKGFKSLQGRKGVIRRTENIYPLFQGNLELDTDVTLETTESAFQKVLSGEADYLLGSPYSIEAELRRFKLHNDIVPAKSGISSATMFMVVTRATDCFKMEKVFSDALKEYQKDPKKTERELRKVIDEFGERFRMNEKMTVPDKTEE